MPHIRRFPIHRLLRAAGILGLLGKLDFSRLSARDRVAVMACRAKAVDELLDPANAYAGDAGSPGPAAAPY